MLNSSDFITSVMILDRIFRSVLTRVESITVCLRVNLIVNVCTRRYILNQFLFRLSRDPAKQTTTTTNVIIKYLNMGHGSREPFKHIAV